MSELFLSRHGSSLRLILTSVLASWGACAFAAPPELKTLFPLGAARGTSAEITATGTFPKWPVQAWASGDGVRIEPAKEKGKFTVKVDADAIPGVRWVRLLGDDGASKPRPLVISSAREVLEKETNDALSKAEGVEVTPVVVNGALAKADDVDTFRVSLKRDQTLIASLDANTLLGSPIDAVLQLVDSAGFVVDQNHDDRGLDPRIVRRIARDGDYYVRIFAFPSDPNSTIRFHGAADAFYRLTLTTGPLVDHVFPTAVDAAKPGAARLEGWNLADAKDIQIASPPAAGTTGEVMPPANFVGSAEIVGVDVPTCLESEPNERAKPQAIAAPCVVNARIDAAGDRDAYLLDCKKGESWRIRVQSKQWGFAVDPLLLVEDADGKQLLRSDDAARGNADVDATFKVPADGTYRLVVEDLFGAAGPRHLYLLDVRKPQADFALSVAASEFAGEAGKPVAMEVAVERPAGLTADVELTIEGLPKGVAAVTGTSTNKGDAAKKVTLQVPPTVAFAGPVRIVGVVQGDAPIRRVATSPVAGLPQGRISELWLTLKPKK